MKLVAVVLATLAATAGVALATGTVTVAVGRGGVISACSLPSGQLRLADASGGTCRANETSLNWNVQGIQGKDGTARAFANVQYTGSLVSDGVHEFRRNVLTAKKIDDGAYCVVAAVPVANAVATPISRTAVIVAQVFFGGTISGRDGDCTSTEEHPATLVHTYALDAPHAAADTGFYIALN